MMDCLISFITEKSLLLSPVNLTVVSWIDQVDFSVNIKIRLDQVLDFYKQPIKCVLHAMKRQSMASSRAETKEL